MDWGENFCIQNTAGPQIRFPPPPLSYLCQEKSKTQAFLFAFQSRNALYSEHILFSVGGARNFFVNLYKTTGNHQSSLRTCRRQSQLISSEARFSVHSTSHWLCSGGSRKFGGFTDKMASSTVMQFSAKCATRGVTFRGKIRPYTDPTHLPNSWSFAKGWQALVKFAKAPSRSHAKNGTHRFASPGKSTRKLFRLTSRIRFAYKFGVHAFACNSCCLNRPTWNNEFHVGVLPVRARRKAPLQQLRLLIFRPGLL